MQYRGQILNFRALVALFSIFTFSNESIAIERLRLEDENTSNVKKLYYVLDLENGAYVNGICFIATGVSGNKIFSILDGNFIGGVSNQLPGLSSALKKISFKQFDSYCGITAGGERREDGSIRKAMKVKYKADLFIDVYSNNERLALITDAGSCGAISKNFFGLNHRSHCYKTYFSESKYSELKTEGEKNFIEVEKAVTGIAACIQFTNLKNDKRTSLVVYLGAVPQALSDQVSREVLPGSNVDANQAELMKKTCSQRGFSL